MDANTENKPRNVSDNIKNRIKQFENCTTLDPSSFVDTQIEDQKCFLTNHTTREEQSTEQCDIKPSDMFIKKSPTQNSRIVFNEATMSVEALCTASEISGECVYYDSVQTPLKPNFSTLPVKLDAETKNVLHLSTKTVCNTVPRAKSEHTTPLWSAPLVTAVDSTVETQTIDPCKDMRAGPHEPPHPRSSNKICQRTGLASYFGDAQLTQMVEDRMVMFRPSSSQNNVDSSLNYNHPYQTAPEEANASHVKKWFGSNKPQPSTANEEISQRNNSEIVVGESPGSAQQGNNSTSSFLPRELTYPSPTSQNSSPMVYTPQAVPLVDVKQQPCSPTLKQCMCSWSPF